MLALVGLVWLYQFFYESKHRAILQNSFVRVGAAVFMVLSLVPLFHRRRGLSFTFSFKP